jgi:hypothetical protein
VVVLPAPFGPSSPQLAGLDVEGQVVDDESVAIAFFDVRKSIGATDMGRVSL